MSPRSLPHVPLAHDDPHADALARAAGPHGVYVRNALAERDGSGLLLLHRGEPAGLCWFGERGNLVVIAPQLDPDGVTAAILQSRLPFRLAMGPAAVVDALAAHSARSALVLRDQLYYTATAATVDAAMAALGSEARHAERGDRDRLAQATLMLNESDLNIDPRRVDRRWLRDSIDERIGQRTTFVLGPVGAFAGKLDHGSDGPGGLVLEGVFTFPEVRGQGTAAALVAASIAMAPGDVCLHVSAINRPARTAYEKAGMRECGRCRILLLA